MDCEAIGEAIQKRRRELRLTLVELKERTGLSQSQVSHMANGKEYEYRPETLGRMSEALDWPTTTLEEIAYGAPYPKALEDEDKYEVLLRRLDDLTAAVERLTSVLVRTR